MRSKYGGWLYRDYDGNVIDKDTLPRRKFRGEAMTKLSKSLKAAHAQAQSRAYVSLDTRYRKKCFNKVRRCQVECVLPSQLSMAVEYLLEKLYAVKEEGGEIGIHAVEESIINLR